MLEEMSLAHAEVGRNINNVTGKNKFLPPDFSSQIFSRGQKRDKFFTFNPDPSL
jgi:hypothetical protein